jgi:hypothetical protein
MDRENKVPHIPSRDEFKDKLRLELLEKKQRWFGASIRESNNLESLDRLGADAARTQEEIEAIKQRINRTDLVK